MQISIRWINMYLLIWQLIIFLFHSFKCTLYLLSSSSNYYQLAIHYLGTHVIVYMYVLVFYDSIWCCCLYLVRLWSLQTYTALVCFKGHHYPVWGVEFRYTCMSNYYISVLFHSIALYGSPLGYYFASCSFDRTARVWNTDQIQPLRILAGHSSDVDVSIIQWNLYNKDTFWGPKSDF